MSDEKRGLYEQLPLIPEAIPPTYSDQQMRLFSDISVSGVEIKSEESPTDRKRGVDLFTKVEEKSLFD